MNKLQIVDFLLMFTGKVNRNELMEIADISIATATRTITQYREGFPDNIGYNVGKKCYEITNAFEPAFDHNCNSALKAVAYGKKIESTRLSKTIGPVLDTNIESHLNIKVASTICRAIYSCTALSVEYMSSTNNHEHRQRLIVPTAIFESRNNWYIRACEISDKSRYKNFKLIRFITAQENTKKVSLEQDVEWLANVVLTIGPHIKHPNPEALKLDLGLSHRPVVNLKVSSALAGFLLCELGVDASQDAILNPYHFQFSLLNRHELLNVESMKIAPGYKTKNFNVK